MADKSSLFAEITCCYFSASIYHNPNMSIPPQELKDMDVPKFKYRIWRHIRRLGI